MKAEPRQTIPSFVCNCHSRDSYQEVVHTTPGALETESICQTNPFSEFPAKLARRFPVSWRNPARLCSLSRFIYVVGFSLERKQEEQNESFAYSISVPIRRRRNDKRTVNYFSRNKSGILVTMKTSVSKNRCAYCRAWLAKRGFREYTRKESRYELPHGTRKVIRLGGEEGAPTCNPE